MAYSFEIQYKTGKSNLVADALSRKTGGKVELGAIVLISRVDWNDLQAEVKADQTLQQIIQDLQSQHKGHVGFQMVGERLYKYPNVLISETSCWQSITHHLWEVTQKR